jgi:GH18 family chitinase
MYNVTFINSTNWGNSGTGVISITNITSKPITDWKIVLKLENIDIQTLWNFNVVKNDSYFTITGKEYNKTIKAQETILSGFLYKGNTAFLVSSDDVNVKLINNVPLNLKSNNPPVVTPPVVTPPVVTPPVVTPPVVTPPVVTPPVVTPPVVNPPVVTPPVSSGFKYEVEIKSTENWGTGGNGSITIKNISNTVLNPWNFNITLENMNIKEIWNLDFSKINTTDLKISGKEWNKSLAIGATITSGFSYDGPKKYNVLTKDPNVKLILPAEEVIVPVAGPKTKKKIMGYLAQWDIYGRNYQIKDIPGDKLTHIMYAFCLPNPNQEDYDLLKKNYPFPPLPYYAPPKLAEGAFAIHDEYAFETQVSEFASLKKKYPHLKICVSMGGWSLSWNMSKIMKDKILRNIFITTSIDAIIKYDFDGFDLDWEFPGRQGVGYNYVDEVNDRINLEIFFKELRTELKRRIPNKYIEVSVATGCNPIVLEQYKNCAEYLDYMNLMSYDYYGSWGDGGHNSPLYDNPLQKATDNKFNAHDSVQIILKYFPPEKVALGIPFYGRGWSKLEKDPAKPNAPIIFGLNKGGPGVTKSVNTGGEPGLTCWKDLRDWVNKSPNIEVFDDVSKTNYCNNPSTGETWTYDNPKSVAIKSKYVNQYKLAGVMIWQLSDDVRDGRESLLDAVVNNLE